MKSPARQAFYFHPLLLGLYPVLALLANNADQVRPLAALRAGLISLAGCLLLYLALRLALRDAGKAALLASAWLVLFFSYGHVYQLIEGQAVFGVVLGKHRYLLIAWLALLAASFAILKLRPKPRALNHMLNAASLALLLLPLMQIGLFELRMQRLSRSEQAGQAAAAVEQPEAGTSSQAQGSSPDIYYIILDGYSRADVMQDLYGLDIHPFMEELQRTGFVFPDCAQSNYGVTAFSMHAALNMEYLQASPSVPLGSDLPKIDYLAMRDGLRHSRVRQFLSQQGYQMVTFETGYWWLEVDDAETYIVANNNPLTQYSQGYQVSNFEEMFLRTTALRVLSEANSAFLSPLTKRVRTPREHHYDVVKFALEELEKVPEIPGKKFVYFHLLAPHDPFVFDAEGNYALPKGDSDIPGYPDEVTYLNKRLIELVRSLIVQSATPPIIILQSDHGWDPRYRMQILNAYYLPEGMQEQLYPTITPVNTFRLILSEAFGADLPLLEDASYFSFGSDIPEYGVRSTPYQLEQVPITCMGEEK